MLACSDFEAMEIALACHMALGDPETPFFILQNCRGTYDAERTLEVARRYQQLYPDRIEIIESYRPDWPYRTIRRTLDNELAGFRYVCKVDDDAFPLTAGWLQRLHATLLTAEEEPGEVAYVTPLINNNNDGFPRVIAAMCLEAEYARDIATAHYAGAGASRRLVQKGEIATGINGTIWSQPHVARWLHQRSTLEPDKLIAATARGAAVDLPADERFSINCILFRRELWSRIAGPGGRDDEDLLHRHCRDNDARIVCATGIPFIHLAYATQRSENRDLLPPIRALYQQRLGLPYPIALHADRLLEIEARLKWGRNRSTPWLQLRAALRNLIRRR
jgi:hypothetical protein